MVNLAEKFWPSWVTRGREKAVGYTPAKYSGGSREDIAKGAGYGDWNQYVKAMEAKAAAATRAAAIADEQKRQAALELQKRREEALERVRIATQERFDREAEEKRQKELKQQKITTTTATPTRDWASTLEGAYGYSLF